MNDIHALIKHSNSILICTHRKPDGDAIGSILALSGALQKLDKSVTTLCVDELPERYHFLSEAKNVNKEIKTSNDYVISLDCGSTEVDKLKYHLEDNTIHIVVSPKEGDFRDAKLSSRQSDADFDLIITVDVADQGQLGSIYGTYSSIFSSTPLINIDHHISNSGFGTLDLINTQASSTAEILFDVIKSLEEKYNKTLIDSDIATALLCGIATDTGSFQNANTSPRSMEIASQLIAAGGNQHDIVKYLFRTKKLITLKLWGKILSHIQVDKRHKIVWSTITQEDLQQTGAQIDDIGEIIDELLVHVPDAEMVLLFKEEPHQVSVSLRSKSSEVNVMRIAEHFGGGGHIQAAGIKLPDQQLSETMSQILSFAQLQQQDRLGLKPLSDFSVPHNKNEGIQQQQLEMRSPTPQQDKSLEQKAQALEKNIKDTSNRNSEETVKPQQKPPLIDINQQAQVAIEKEQKPEQDEVIDTFSMSPSKGMKRREKPASPQSFDQPVPDYLQASANEFSEQIQQSSPTDTKPKEQNLPPSLTAESAENSEDKSVKIRYKKPSTSNQNETPSTQEESSTKIRIKQKTPQQDKANEDTPQLKQTPDSVQDLPPLQTDKNSEVVDPFSQQEDDGLSDIERALSNL